ncbi:hypothetical protein KSD_16230 [Ktedonobacter sp. SOSP1-85]|uniref:outer membrane protein assembly factor BamB family protein n=1 Tax=Ktedonobacter sp. SOSP1-85 TaxID=2778367 RepID=UPI001915F8E1|nr:PQQ-binding-like beta-propeller repeat protein [Ktedonobacter sp. SOSP1-85]GHO73852.1 hypothetical protein KSD_16230 [Ktedonobacter sp. SOSP1-85]
MSYHILKALKVHKCIPSYLLLLALCLFLAGCGLTPTSQTQTPIQVKTSPTSTVRAMPPSPSPQLEPVQYAVSWDVDRQQPYSNQGISSLHVTAFETNTGHILWQHEPLKLKDLYRGSQQRIIDGVLYITSSSVQHVTLNLALDLQDGHVLWEHEYQEMGIKETGNLGIIFCKDTIYQNKEATVQAIQARNGQIRWSYKSSTVITQLVPTSTAVYLVETIENQQSQNGSSVFVTALDPADGKALWRKAYPTADNNVTFTLVATKGAVLAINQITLNPIPNGPIASVQALQPETGQSIWATLMPAYIDRLSVTTFGNILYLNGRNLLYNPKTHSYEPHQGKLLIAFDALTGKLLWQREHNYEGFALLSEQELYAYKGNQDNEAPKHTICALDTTTGKERWCIDSLRPDLYGMSSNQDTLIVVDTLQSSLHSLQLNLYAINKLDGKILWHQPWQSSAPSLVTFMLATVTPGQDAVFFG